MLRYTTDTARPGFVAFYNIWPGNRAGLLVQARSPHGAKLMKSNYGGQSCRMISNRILCTGNIWSAVVIYKQYQYNQQALDTAHPCSLIHSLKCTVSLLFVTHSLFALWPSEAKSISYQDVSRSSYAPNLVTFTLNGNKVMDTILIWTVASFLTHTQLHLKQLTFNNNQ